MRKTKSKSFFSLAPTLPVAQVESGINALFDLSLAEGTIACMADVRKGSGRDFWHENASEGEPSPSRAFRVSQAPRILQTYHWPVPGILNVGKARRCVKDSKHQRESALS